MPILHKHKLTKLDVFGHKDLFCDKEYPSNEEMSSFPEGKNVKLRKIYYKNGFGSSLKAIKLEFTYGVSTPLFEVDDKEGNSLKSVEVDSSRTIRKIKMDVCKSTN